MFLCFLRFIEHELANVILSFMKFEQIFFLKEAVSFMKTVIKRYRFLQVFIGNMMVLQIFCMKIKHDIFPLYKPLIFCVKMNQ